MTPKYDVLNAIIISGTNARHAPVARKKEVKKDDLFTKIVAEKDSNNEAAKIPQMIPTH